MTELILPKLFNEFGSDSYESQKIVGGNPTGISNLNNVRYPWINPTFRTMVGNFWIPQKVSLIEDRVTIKQLEKDEQESLENTLSFLIYLDSYQTNNLPNIADYVTCQALKNLLVYQASQEVIHTESYQYILQELFTETHTNIIYDKWRTNNVLKDRNKMIADIGQEFLDKKDYNSFCKVTVANLALEGVYFYQGFNFFDQLAHRKKLVQTAKIIDYIRVDERIHVGIFANMIKELKIPDSIINPIMDMSVETEEGWCHSNYGNRILGITEKSSSEYVRWLADDVLVKSGKQKRYGSKKDPYSHINAASSTGMRRGNFFENSAITEYDTADAVSGWDTL